MKTCTKFATALTLATLFAASLSAQGIYATLTGVVTDQSTAVVAKAKVTLTDTQSGSVRETLTNNDGYFTFASVPVGSYNLAIESKGFALYKANGIALSGGGPPGPSPILTRAQLPNTARKATVTTPLSVQIQRPCVGRGPGPVCTGGAVSDGMARPP